jgi:hypothetical protein
MIYAISDNIKSIRFVAGDKETLVCKQAIKEVLIVRDGLLRLDTGNSTIMFNHADVGSPSTPTPDVLLGLISDWINDAPPPPL